MISYTKEQLEEHLATLPPAVQEALGSAETGEALRRIGSRHHLHIDQMGVLNDVTAFVMLGLIPRETYLTTLQTELDIPEEEARLIIEDVNIQILTPMNAALREETSQHSTEDTEEGEDGVELSMPTRDEILREIESPSSSPSKEVYRDTPAHVPVNHNGDDTSSFAMTSDREVAEQSQIKKPLQETPALDIVHTKLGNVSRIPPAKTESGEHPSDTPSSVLDPYRETVE
jgi:hypothetical protein